MNQVIDVLSSTQSAASTTTHALKLLGKGNMGNGIRIIHAHGVLTGCLIGGWYYCNSMRCGVPYCK